MGIWLIVQTLLVVGLGLGLSALVFLNEDPIRLQLGVTDIPETPAGYVAAGAFICGLLFGLITMTVPLLSRISRQRSMRKQLDGLEAEVRDLRTLPLQDEQ